MTHFPRPAIHLAFSLVSLLTLPACVTDDQQVAQETVISTKQDENADLLPDTAGDLASEQVTNPVIKEKTPALTPDDIEADNDPMKIGFETARWGLSEVALGRISDVAEQLRADDSVTLKIDGHCDERGSEAYNLELSQRRADEVRKELIRLGISPKRLKAQGYGKKRQLQKGHTEKHYSHNRRAEMIFSK